MKKRLLSLVLCLVMVFALFPTFAAPAMAADANGITNPAPTADPSGKLNLTKNLAPGADGTYDITMESWATGEVKTQGIVEKIPTDFVLVVDQSGSMDTRDMPTGTPSVQNNKYLEDIAAGAYYYKDGDNYYRVYGVKDYLFRYYPANYYYVGDIVRRLNQRLSWFMGDTDATANFANQLYFRETVGGKVYYQPITLTVAGRIGTYVISFKYNSKITNGEVEFNRDDETYMNGHHAPWYKNLAGGGLIDDNWGISLPLIGRVGYPQVDDVVQGLYRNDNEYTHSTFQIIPEIVFGGWKLETGMFVNYPMYDRHVGYTKLAYRDVNGVEHVVASNQNGQTTWEFCDDDGIARSQQAADSARPTYSGLYTFPTNDERITALKAALNEFAQAVANEEDDFGAVDNRVSIVGFSGTSSSVAHDPSGSPNYSNYNYNTELLTHTDRNIANNSTNGWQKSECDSSISEFYGKALVGATNGSVGTVNSKISRAITAITANGGTQPEDGLNMAYKVLTNRGTGEGKDTYTIRSGEREGQTVDRNTVVIFFTDGQPGNLHMSDQYSEANEVVSEASNIKGYKNTSIYSIGVFGVSDANPLTYDGRNDYTTDNQGNRVRVSSLNRGYWEYLGGWVETHQSNGTYFCLRRQWRPNNADGYTANPNDTIFDYMSVVSSNYPDAENFIAPAWLAGNYVPANDYVGATDGVRHIETHVTENGQRVNKYYRMASNQDTLVKAFLQAVTMNNEEITSDTSVPLDATAIFKDKVNLADFDITGATYTVQWQPVKEQNGQIVNNGSAVTKVDPTAVPADGQINYSGFNYSANFVTSAHDGQKLVVTITGLTPKKASGTLVSNDGKAGVYGPEDEEATVEIASPTLELTGSHDKTYIIDFNAEMKVATGATQLKADARENPNGEFNKANNGDVTYKLNGGLNGGTFTASYSGVDSAMIYGVPVNSAAGTTAAWNKITTVPANNIYFDDDLGQLTATENGSGYNSQIRVLKEETVADGPFTFTFKGSRIDIYCTTEGTSGGVTATLKQGDTVITNNIISNKYQGGGALYNVPTVVFEGLDPASEYTVTIKTNGSSNYKLDGVRVYNAAAETGDVAKAYSDAGEANSIFLKVRDQLLPNSMISTLNQYLDDLAAYNALEDKDGVEPPTEPQNIPGVAFYKDVAYEEGANKYAKLSDYVKTGPKNEVYLTNGEVVSFAIKNCPDDMQVWIGLSALDGKTGSIEVNDEAYTPDIASTVDMYYKVTPKEIEGEQTLKIKNVGSSMISVTNVKITGSNATNPSLNASVLSVADAESAASVLSVEDGLPYLAVTPRLLNSLNAPAQAEDPEPTPTADPEPTPTADPEPTPTQQPSFAEWISNLLSSFVNALFGSIARLFGH